MFLEYRDKHGHDEDSAKAHALNEFAEAANACCEETPCQWGSHPCERKKAVRSETQPPKERIEEIAYAAWRKLSNQNFANVAGEIGDAIREALGIPYAPWKYPGTPSSDKNSGWSSDTLAAVLEYQLDPVRAKYCDWSEVPEIKVTLSASKWAQIVRALRSTPSATQRTIYMAEVKTLVGDANVRVRFVAREHIKDRPTEANPSPIRVLLVGELPTAEGIAHSSEGTAQPHQPPKVPGWDPKA